MCTKSMTNTNLYKLNYLLITSAKEVTFLPLCVCLSVSRITQKVVDKF